MDSVPAGVPFEEQIACIEREIGFRERLYPRWIKSGKINQAAADTELARIRAVLLSLQAMRPVIPLDATSIAEAKLAERERVLAIVAKHMHSSSFVRVAAKVAS